MNKINNQLEKILKKTFSTVKISKKKNPKAGDFEQWDSIKAPKPNILRLHDRDGGITKCG